MMNALLLIGLLLSTWSGGPVRQARSAAKPTIADTTLHLVGRYYTGTTRSIEAVGDTVFYGSGFYLVAASVADPAHPVELGRFRLAQPVRTHALWNDEVYVACQDSLYILRLGRRGVWRNRGPVSLRSWTNDLVVKDGLAYVAVDWVGLQILDVRSPGRPREVGHFALPIGTDSNRHAAFGIDVVGGLAFLATTQGLRVLDVSDPQAPRELSALLFCQRWSYSCARRVFVAGSTAYLVDFERGIRLLDVTDPEAPVEVGFFETPTFALDVWVKNDRAYVITDEALHVVDVGDPRAPKEISVMDLGVHYPTSITVAGRYAYVSFFRGPLLVVDVTTPSMPHLVSRFDMYGARMVNVAAGLAYLAAGDLVILESPVFRTGTVKPVREGPAVRLESYPNPFQGMATITFTLEQPSEHVTLTVYDVLGRTVTHLVNGPRPAGKHRAVWDGRGRAPGVYVYRVTAESTAGHTWHATGQFVLVR